MEYVDLHVHSDASDGTMKPAELVAYAAQKGLKAFALTDHDTTDGIEEALEAAKSYPVTVIPGIEFTTEYHGRDIHIVGLNIDYKNVYFLEQLKAFQEERDTRNAKMAALLREHGMEVTMEALYERFPDAVITRAHFGRYLLETGQIKEIRTAFDKYIGDHGPCFVPREKIPPFKAIQIILEAGGVPVLAHPILYRMRDDDLDQLVAECKKAGLVGIEAIYSTYASCEESQIRKLARKYDLKISGGSDFHGTNKPTIDLGVGRGNLKIPYEVLTNLLSN